MTHQEFASLVAKMRSLQKEYFRDRSRSTLDQCKFIEREVDRELEERRKAPHHQSAPQDSH